MILNGLTSISGVQGAVVGQDYILGDAYLQNSYQYSYDHLWRNLGILLAFTTFFLIWYLFATELNTATSNSAQVLVFRPGHLPSDLAEEEAEKQAVNDEEIPAALKTVPGRDDFKHDEEQTQKMNSLMPHKDIFSWRHIHCDIKIKGETHRILDNVSGWVKPGTITALMGVSGAGKTTLLDVLAQRSSIGIITGKMLVSGHPLDASFQRKTGYVQQQDLHLETTTVREALRFSAMLRQPQSVSKASKYSFVEDVIKMLHMQAFSEAVVGIPGKGLNVEQRKLLTIGVELAAKPELLLFLDEPTSGLDSQSSWAIVTFLRKLADSGQAILTTIHQPSAIIFQQFDRLLLLTTGGKTAYFGDIGQNSETLVNYFADQGVKKCEKDENPAEYMLNMIGPGTGGNLSKNWHEIWDNSQENRNVQRELEEMEMNLSSTGSIRVSTESSSEFAMPFSSQLYQTTIRVFRQYWRTPEYIFSKLLLGAAAALFIGFSFFHADASQQGLQDTAFGIFMLTSIFTTIVQQILPRFLLQRDLYEVRERPSKSYSWKAFLISNMIVEIPYQILLGIIVFSSLYYPIFTTAGMQSSDRQGLILLFFVQFFVFASTFAHMIISALPDAMTAGFIATLMFSLCCIFNGVFQPPSTLPSFWIFMYRVSPMSYFVGGILSTGLHDRQVTCSANELSVMQPITGYTCGKYLQEYATAAGGLVYNPNATENCEYCSFYVADQYLGTVSIYWSERWRNYGIIFSYIIFNMSMTVVLYYLFRVRKRSSRTVKERFPSIFHSSKNEVGKEKETKEAVRDSGTEKESNMVEKEPTTPKH